MFEKLQKITTSNSNTLIQKIHVHISYISLIYFFCVLILCDSVSIPCEQMQKHKFHNYGFWSPHGLFQYAFSRNACTKNGITSVTSVLFCFFINLFFLTHLCLHDLFSQVLLEYLTFSFVLLTIFSCFRLNFQYYGQKTFTGVLLNTRSYRRIQNSFNQLESKYPLRRYALTAGHTAFLLKKMLLIF